MHVIDMLSLQTIYTRKFEHGQCCCQNYYTIIHIEELLESIVHSFGFTACQIWKGITVYMYTSCHLYIYIYIYIYMHIYL